MPLDRLAASTRRATMRQLFDSAFARPVTAVTESFADLLAVRVGGDPYALRLRDITGLHVDLDIVPVPSPAQHLLGIAALRGTMAPVYDLAGLLGYPPARRSRWIVMTGSEHSVGLAFESFDAHVRVSETQMDSKAPIESPQARAFAHGVVDAAAALRPILQIAVLIQSIGESVHAR
jgi:chemotaxis signal transduction protein